MALMKLLGRRGSPFWSSDDAYNPIWLKISNAVWGIKGSNIWAQMWTMLTQIAFMAPALALLKKINNEAKPISTYAKFYAFLKDSKKIQAKTNTIKDHFRLTGCQPN